MSFELLPKVPSHPSEELLEEYTFQRVCDPELTALEEHLLICAHCQARVERLDDYKALMKSVTSAWVRDREEFGSGPAPRFASLLPSLLLVVGLASFLASAAFFGRSHKPWFAKSASPSTSVELLAMRGGAPKGGAPGGLAQAPSGQPLDLAMDGTNLPPAAGYRLEVVNQSGQEVWSGAATVSGAKLSAHMAAGPRAGVYWVRLYSYGGDLLREFGMRLE